MTRVTRNLPEANVGASMRPAQIIDLLSLFAWPAFSQTDRGAITGTIA
jgi:hypothetical protein